MIKLKNVVKFFQHLPRFYFSRKIKEAGTLKERQIYHEDAKLVETEFEHKPAERIDPNSQEIDEPFIANCRLNAQHLPERLLKRITQIFSKYNAKDLRKYGTDYLNIYRSLNASEKPLLDYNKAKPFANTEHIIEENQKLIYLRSKKIDMHTAERVVQEKREEKEKKKAAAAEPISKIIEENKRTEEGIPILLYTQNMALGYLLKKMPNTFSVACRVFSEVRYRLPTFKPNNFLDFGAGMGSGSWAFYDVFPDGKHIVACEPSKIMRKVGKHLTQDMDKINWIDMLAKTAVYDYARGFDIVYCGYVLEEATNAETRLLIMESLWQKVNDNGVLIVIETGTPRGFRFIHDVRRWIIQKTREEATIVAPCPHHKKCPLSDKGTWCHFDQPMGVYPKSVFPKLSKDDTIFYEKFSYLIIKKGVIKIDKKEKNEDLLPYEKAFGWGRIVRPIMKKSQHRIIDVCAKEGELERIIVAKSHEGTAYKEAKKLRWGDLWRFEKRIPNRYRKEVGKGKRLW